MIHNKIIIFGGIPKQTKDLSLDDITGTPALYSYFLRKEFEKLGIDTEYCEAHSQRSIDKEINKIVIPMGDHIISVCQRGFTHRCRPSNNLLQNTRKAISGKIASICDKRVKDPVEDIIFTAVPHKKIDKNIHVGWACDHSLLTPTKDKDTIRILIDHAYYGSVDHNDRTADISRQCLDFQNYSDKKVVIRRFSGPQGCEDVTETNWNIDFYDRTTSMPYPKACEEYKKADIFIVTHQESLGMSVLESAAAGAYVAVPEDCIEESILTNIRHVTFKDKIPFDYILPLLSPQASIEPTLQYSWKKLTATMLKILEKDEMKKIPQIPEELLKDWDNLDISELELSSDHKFLDRKVQIPLNWTRLHIWIPEYLDSKYSAVDISSGNGATLEILRYYGLKTLGVDYSGKTKDGQPKCMYEPLLQSQKLDYILHDCSKFPYPLKDDEFDIVINYGSINQYGKCEIWTKVLDELSRIAKKCILFAVNLSAEYDKAKTLINEWSKKNTKFKLVRRHSSGYKWVAIDK